MWQILKQFDSPYFNNSRDIIRGKLIKMRDYPSERQVQELERFGIECDWSDKDYGELPVRYA